MSEIKSKQIFVSELPPELKNGGNLQNQFLKFVDPSKGTRWFRPTTLSELSSIQKDHETFRRFMGGTGGYKRDDFSYNHPVTVQLDSIPDLVQINILIPKLKGLKYQIILYLKNCF